MSSGEAHSRPCSLTSNTCVPFCSHGRPISGPGGFVSLLRSNTVLYLNSSGCAFLEKYPFRASGWANGWGGEGTTPSVPWDVTLGGPGAPVAGAILKGL